MPSTTFKVSPEEISGQYKDKFVQLIKEPLQNARLVRGLEYPVSYVLKVDSSTVDGSQNDEENSTAIKEFFHEFGKSGTFRNLVSAHGLFIVKNLGSTDPEQYSEIMRSLFKGQNYEEFDQVGLLAARKKVKEAVSTVGNDEELGRNLGKLNSHQEFSRYSDYPHILTFFAQKAPKLPGGESTTTHATELFDKVNEKYPGFIRDLYEKEGNHLFQKFCYAVSEDSKFKISWTDKNAFGRYITKEDLANGDIEVLKAKATKLAKERVSDWIEFDENNDLIVHQKNNIVEIHPFTGRPVIFSSLPTYYGGYYRSKQGLSEAQLAKLTPPPLTYGNGEPIPEKYLDYLFEQSEELEYAHRFADGDIMFLDNYSVYHGRNPYTFGDRTILASFWEQPKDGRKRPYKPYEFAKFFE